MTIEVLVTNTDKREGAIIVVKSVTKEGSLLTAADVELSGGKSHKFYVHSNLNLVVEEVKNG